MTTASIDLLGSQPPQIPPRIVSKANGDLDNTAAPHSSRKASVAETILEQVRIKDSRDTSWNNHTREEQTGQGGSRSRRHSLTSPISTSSASLGTYNTHTGPKTSTAAKQHAPRIRPSRSPSHGSIVQAPPPAPILAYPPDLLPLLDGEHHTDELGTRFEAGWPLLEQWLMAVGGSQENGSFGRVSIIHR